MTLPDHLLERVSAIQVKIHDLATELDHISHMASFLERPTRLDRAILDSVSRELVSSGRKISSLRGLGGSVGRFQEGGATHLAGAPKSLQEPADGVPVTGCNHGVKFDPIVVEGLEPAQVRTRYPRLDGSCPHGCGFTGVAYASWEHYFAGDW